jgi:hypothetical protein
MATLPYTAPEIFAAGENALPTPEADRFAFAATAFHVLTGVMPPLRADGRGPDLAALLPILERTPLTAARPEVLATVMAGLSADPVARPTQLVPWLAAARRTDSKALHGDNRDNGAGPTAVLGHGASATTPDLTARSAASPRPSSPTSSLPASPPSSPPRRGSQPEPHRRSGRRRLIAGLALLLVAPLVFAIYYGPWFENEKDGQTTDPRSSPSSNSAIGGPTGTSQPSTTGSTAATSGVSQGPGATTQRPTSAGLARRTLALGEELDVETGTIGSSVQGRDIAWDEYNVNHVYAHGTRFALVPAITTKSACETALSEREDGSIVRARDVSAGKALCLVTEEGHIAAVRITKIDVRDRATFQYTYW